MKISEIITDKYKLRIPPTVYYDLLANVQKLEEEEEPNCSEIPAGSITENCISCKYDEIEESDGEHCKKCLAGDSQFELDKEFVESTTKNNLGVDCIDRNYATRLLADIYHNSISDSSLKIYQIINWLNQLPSVTPQEPTLDELRAEITTLQNRCYALTKGTMCAFCRYECKYKAEMEAE